MTIYPYNGVYLPKNPKEFLSNFFKKRGAVETGTSGFSKDLSALVAKFLQGSDLHSWSQVCRNCYNAIETYPDLRVRHRIYEIQTNSMLKNMFLKFIWQDDNKYIIYMFKATDEPPPMYVTSLSEPFKTVEVRPKESFFQGARVEKLASGKQLLIAAFSSDRYCKIPVLYSRDLDNLSQSDWKVFGKVKYPRFNKPSGAYAWWIRASTDLQREGDAVKFIAIYALQVRVAHKYYLYTGELRTHIQYFNLEETDK